MKFSVLLPTRNGACFLANCVESILNQAYDDFELVISDNANNDGTPEILRGYAAEPRVKILRQESVLPVSDNWSATLQASTGDYVIMMGDDDYMLPGYLRRMAAVIERHGEPDCVIYNGYSFVHPEAIAGESKSYWSRRHYAFGPEFASEGPMSHELRLSIVRDMFRFRQRIPLNMQTAVFRRSTADKVRGGVFPPPFPDHYLLNALLISAERWIYLPDRLVVVGVSPKSFGHYHYSQKGGQGLSYLGVDTGFRGALPGNELINGVCAWLMRLKENYPDVLRRIDIDRAGYVCRQVFTWLQDYRYGGIRAGELAARFRLLSPADWWGLFSAVAELESWRYLWRLLSSLGGSKARSLWRGLEPLDQVSDIRSFAQWLQHNNPQVTE